MKERNISWRNFMRAFGINPIRVIQTILRYPSFFKDYVRVKSEIKNGQNDFPFGSLFPCLHDKFDVSGQATGHYFHQDILVASKIFENNPNYHFDVGSRIDGFVAHVACYRKISVIDIRKLESTTDNIEYLQADMMNELPAELNQSTDSLSCLHTIEHFGLGRYGDPINLSGHLIGFSNLKKMLQKGGILYFSVPIGSQRIEFNAHRVFSIGYLIDMFGTDLSIKAFSFVDDKGDLHKNVVLDAAMIENNCDCKYGCGIFELIKK